MQKLKDSIHVHVDVDYINYRKRIEGKTVKGDINDVNTFIAEKDPLEYFICKVDTITSFAIHRSEMIDDKMLEHLKKRAMVSLYYDLTGTLQGKFQQLEAMLRNLWFSPYTMGNDALVQLLDEIKNELKYEPILEGQE